MILRGPSPRRPPRCGGDVQDGSSPSQRSRPARGPASDVLVGGLVRGVGRGPWSLGDRWGHWAPWGFWVVGVRLGCAFWGFGVFGFYPVGSLIFWGGGVSLLVLGGLALRWFHRFLREAGVVVRTGPTSRPLPGGWPVHLALRGGRAVRFALPAGPSGGWPGASRTLLILLGTARLASQKIPRQIFSSGSVCGPGGDVLRSVGLAWSSGRTWANPGFRLL